MAYFSGRVHSLLFEDTEANFYIMKMSLDNIKGHTVVRGHVSGMTVQIGTWIGLEGDWVNHETYGKQIAITKAPVIDTWTPDVVCAVLSANGVGERLIRHIHQTLGDDLFPKALDAPDTFLLETVDGVTVSQAEHILSRWRTVKAFFRTVQFLSDANVPKNRINQVWSVFKDNAEEILATNPWALVAIDGITFAQADAVAKRLDLSLNDPKRIEGAILFAMKNQKGMGHMFQTSGELMAGTQALVSGAEITHKMIAESIVSLSKEKKIVLDRTTRPGVTAIFEPWLYQMEAQSAELLKARVQTAVFSPDFTQRYLQALSHTGPHAEASYAKDSQDLRGVVVGALQDWSTASKLNLSAAQQVGAANALLEPVSIITGLPGTGKSSTLRAIISLLRDAGQRVLLLAPTGIAAKRMAAITGMTASTIHRAFGAKGWDKNDDEREATYAGVTGTSDQVSSDGSAELWVCSKEPYDADVVICDETSMVDQHLLYRILSCTRPTARLVFIGDAAQLPSVGPGNVLRDLINSKAFPTVSLTEIFRQALTSQIVVAAHAINRGEMPVASTRLTDDFVFIPLQDEEKVSSLLCEIATDLYTKRENFQVLSPRHAGAVGVTALNGKLRETLNPKQPGLGEMRLGSEIIREDDRVMVVRNNYELDVFNGDVGKVGNLRSGLKEVEVKIHGPPIQYIRFPNKDAASHLRLAYCITIHKSQGSEFDVMVMPIMSNFGQQLQRNLLYTAVTRAKKRVILVGHWDAIAKAVGNNKQDVRNTLFLDRLIKVFG